MVSPYLVYTTFASLRKRIGIGHTSQAVHDMSDCATRPDVNYLSSSKRQLRPGCSSAQRPLRLSGKTLRGVSDSPRFTRDLQEEQEEWKMQSSRQDSRANIALFCRSSNCRHGRRIKRRSSSLDRMIIPLSPCPEVTVALCRTPSAGAHSQTQCCIKRATNTLLRIADGYPSGSTSCPWAEFESQQTRKRRFTPIKQPIQTPHAFPSISAGRISPLRRALAFDTRVLFFHLPILVSAL